MSVIITKSNTATLNPTKLYNSSARAIGGQGSGYTNSSSSSYASFSLNTGNGITSYVSYGFDVSSIPSDATITSVSCTASVAVSNNSTGRVASDIVQLYNDTTAMGSSVTAAVGSTTKRTVTISTSQSGTWTRSALDNINIRQTVTRGTSNATNTYYGRFYGANLTVNYTVDEVAYVVTTTVTGGTISTTTPYTAETGTNFVVTAKPNTNYEFSSLKVNGSTISNVTNSSGNYSYTLSNITEDKDVQFLFTAIPQYNVSISVTGCTLVSPTSTPQSVYRGNSLTITVKPNTNYEFSSLKVNGANITSVTSSNGNYTYTLSNITEAKTVEFVCTEKPKYNVNITTQGCSLVTPSSASQSLYKGSSLTMTVTPDEDYEFTEITVNGTAVTTYTVNGDNYTLTLSDITENKNVVFDFHFVLKHNVNITVQGCSLYSPTTATNRIIDGESLTITVTASTNYKFSSLQINGTEIGSIGNNGIYYSYVLSNITEEKNVSIVFLEKQTFNVDISIQGGTLVNPTTNTTTVTEGDNLILKFTGNSGLIWKELVINGTNHEPLLISGTYNYTISNISSDTTVTILFGTVDRNYVKYQGHWERVERILRKIDGTWTEVSAEEFKELKNNLKIIKNQS